MPTCTYCEQTFADEEAYLDHLATEHYTELGRIDTRRVNSAGVEPNSRRIPPRLLIVIIVVNILLVAGLVFALTATSEGSPATSNPQHVELVGAVLIGFINTTVPGDFQCP
jgi:hypothetical protein